MRLFGGMRPTRTGIARDSARAQNRSSAARSQTGCVWANVAPASIFAASFEISTSRSFAAGFAAQPIANDVAAPIAPPARSTPAFRPLTMRRRPSVSTSPTGLACG